MLLWVSEAVAWLGTSAALPIVGALLAVLTRPYANVLEWHA
jgi:hypothetical protein